jgi:transposase-like protein
MSARKKRDEKSAAIAQAILDAYKPTNREDMQEAIKDIFGPMFEAILQGEMDAHLGYESNDHGEKNTDNRRNGYIHKTVNSTYGPIEVNVPRDRDASFEPEISRQNVSQNSSPLEELETDLTVTLR